jgi:electron transfer flavoprotein beta subunit
VIVAACVKLVDLRPEVDRLTGAVTPSTTVGCSAADRAAVELALQLADSWSAESAVLCCGPDRADPVLREFAAAGVDRLVRIDAAGAPDSVDVGGLLAATLRNLDVGVVVCGDHSLDRGSGAVPAYVADGLGAAQALGLVEVRTEGVGTLRATRRLVGVSASSSTHRAWSRSRARWRSSVGRRSPPRCGRTTPSSRSSLRRVW